MSEPSTMASIARRYIRVLDMINRGIMFLLFVVLATMAVIMVAHVCTRYFLNHSFSWSEEAVRYMMLWLVFLGAAIVTRRAGMIAARVVVDNLPRRPRLIVSALGGGIVVVTLGVLVVAGFAVAISMAGRQSAATGISLMLPYLSLPVGGVFMILNHFAALLQSYFLPAEAETEPEVTY